MLQKGFERVLRNAGAPGGDGVTVTTFAMGLDFRLRNLAQRLLSGRYEPGPVEVFKVPKPGKLERRILRVPCVVDRVVQTAAHLTLQPILEPEFEEHSYGYRPGRSVQQAIEALRGFHEAGYSFVVDADIRAYFDNVPHTQLLAALSDYVPERPFLNLVGQWLNLAAQPDQGLPQGAPISPILANLYLDSVDEHITEAGFRIVRYADDFVILCKSQERAETALHLVSQRLADLQLELHPEKTAIRRLDEGYMFLGARMKGVGLAAQIEKLGAFEEEDLFPVFDDPIENAAGRGQLYSTPARRIGSRDIASKERHPAISSFAGDAPWLGERQALALAEGDDPNPPDQVISTEAPSRHAPFVRPLYVMERGRRLDVHDAGFAVCEENEPIAIFAPGALDRIDIFPGAEISNDAIRHAAAQNIPVFFVDWRGTIQSSLAGERPWRARLHLAQARHSYEDDLALKLARQFVSGRIFNARRLIQQLRQRLPKEARADRKDLEEVIDKLDHIYRRADRYPNYETLDELRGDEARAAKLYWPALASLLKRGSAESGFKRTRLPPDTAFNAALNFTAHLLRRDIETLILKRGIHAGFGILHRPDEARYGCVFDLMEEFRAPVAEAVAVQLLSSGELGPQHFEELSLESGKAVHIVDGGLKKVVRAYERHVDHVIRHPDGGKSTWRGVMDHQITRYVRHVLDEETYQAYQKDL